MDGALRVGQSLCSFFDEHPPRVREVDMTIRPIKKIDT